MSQLGNFGGNNWPPRRSIRNSVGDSAAAPSSVVESAFKRFSFSFDIIHSYRKTPSLHPHYGTSSLLWVSPTPSQLALARVSQSLPSPRRMSSSTNLSARAVPKRPGEATIRSVIRQPGASFLLSSLAGFTISGRLVTLTLSIEVDLGSLSVTRRFCPTPPPITKRISRLHHNDYSYAVLDGLLC